MVRVMGVINCTPDSFYDGGVHNEKEQAIAHGLQLIEEGADLLDIGGESARPGSDPTSEKEELKRVLPVLSGLKGCQVPLSIDTRRPKVARAALDVGATFINDITGFRDPKMRALAAESGAEICVMYMQGRPKTMQENPHYPDGVLPTLMRFFEKRIEELTTSGVKEEQIILDPGIGFGQTTEHIVEILKNLSVLKSLGFPILVGCSRKSFLTRALNKPPPQLLSATIAVHTMAIHAGADLIRVHDVQEHRDVVDLLEGIGWIG